MQAFCCPPYGQPNGQRVVRQRPILHGSILVTNLVRWPAGYKQEGVLRLGPGGVSVPQIVLYCVGMVTCKGYY